MFEKNKTGIELDDFVTVTTMQKEGRRNNIFILSIVQTLENFFYTFKLESLSSLEKYKQVREIFLTV